MFGKACLGSALGHDILFRCTQSGSWNLEAGVRSRAEGLQLFRKENRAR